MGIFPKEKLVFFCNIIAFVLCLYKQLAIHRLHMTGFRVIRIILFLVLWIVFQPIKAKIDECKSVISGVLHDHNHQPLIGATVYIKELKTGTTTNLKGKYFLNKLCKGEYTLIFKYLGYKSREVKIHVDSDRITYDLELEDNAIHLEEVAIEQKKLNQEETQTLTLVSIDENTLAKNSGGNLGESLQGITGVNVLQSGPTIAKPVIHGLHSNRILVLNNGIRQEEQQWGAEHANAIDPFIANNLSVIKGAATVRYGSDAIGGVILVNPPELLKTKSLNGSVQTLGISNGRGGATSAMLEGGFDNGIGWRVQGTYKVIGDSETPDYILSNTGLKEFNFSTALGLHKDKYGFEVFYSRFNTYGLGILRSAHSGGVDDLERALSSPEPLFIEDFTYQINNPRQELVHQLIKTSAYYKIANVGKLEAVYAFQFNDRKEFDIRRGGRSDKPALFLELGTHTMDLVLNHKPMGNFQGSIGIQSIIQRNINEDLAERGIRPLIPNYRSYSGSIFWIERFVRESWELEAGIRYDFRHQSVKKRDRSNNLLTPDFDYHMVSGNFGVIYNFNPAWSIRANVSSALRPPSVAELFSEGLHHGVATIEEGNPELDIEKAYKGITTLRFQNHKIRFEVSPFYNYIQNYIYLESREVRLTIRGAFPVARYNQDNAVFWGSDIALSYDLTRFLNFSSKASLLQAKNVTQDSNLPYIPTNQFENSLTFQWSQWKKLNNIYFSVSVQNITQQNRAPELFTITQVREVLANDALELPESTFDFIEAPKGYTLLNLDMGTDISLGRQELGVYFSVQNLLNTSYRDYMNRYKYFADDRGRNFTLRLRYTFQTSKTN